MARRLAMTSGWSESTSTSVQNALRMSSAFGRSRKRCEGCRRRRERSRRWSRASRVEFAQRPRAKQWMSASQLKAAAAALVIFGAGLATGAASELLTLARTVRERAAQSSSTERLP